MRAKFREYLKRPEFKPKYAISLNEERDLALERLQQVTLVAAYIRISYESYRDKQIATIWSHSSTYFSEHKINLQKNYKCLEFIEIVMVYPAGKKAWLL